MSAGGSSPQLPRTAECVIVGGGVIGCSLAYHLARGGLKPLVVERATLGSGSTARGAGGVRQQFSTEVNVRVGMMSRRMLERFPDEIGATADLRQIGYLFLATSDEEAAQFEGVIAQKKAVGSLRIDGGDGSVVPEQQRGNGSGIDERPCCGSHRLGLSLRRWGVDEVPELRYYGITPMPVTAPGELKYPIGAGFLAVTFAA